MYALFNHPVLTLVGLSVVGAGVSAGTMALILWLLGSDD